MPACTYTVRLRDTNNIGPMDRATGTVTVNAAPPRPNMPPLASFTSSPNPATVGEIVRFDAGGSSDPDGTIERYSWDLDNDGQFDDALGVTASRSFATAGTYTVRLRVTDDDGSTDRATATVTVNPAPAAPNRPPLATFTSSPNPALVGQTVRFDAAGSSDPDGTIASYAWDLDNDGQFDDASGVTASRSFALAGTYAVGLRVTDDGGSADAATSVVTVTSGAVQTPATPLPNRPPVASFAPDLMRPFPVVRIVGRSTGYGARIMLLVVRGAPRGAKVTVRCRGRGCRLRSRRQYVRSTSVRFRSFEQRVPAGVRLQVFVTQPGRIGKYTSFQIRAGRRPLRRDLCVTSVSAKPARCPMS